MTTENAFEINNRTETTQALRDDRDLLLAEIEYDRKRVADKQVTIDILIDLGVPAEQVTEATRERQRLGRQIHANELELFEIIAELTRRQRNQKAGLPL